jgi:ferrochelatase
MRYWDPLTPVTVRAVKEMAPDRVVLLPLYPQYSTTTTGSSYRAWMSEATRQGLHCAHHLVCCYPDEPGFVRALAGLVREGLGEARTRAPASKPLVIFSAHGLPKKVVAGGDPYQAQVEASARAVVASLELEPEDWIVAYQSRVGPLEWIGPSTEETIVTASGEKRAIALVPIAFVSEHSETLVELDIEYRHLAESHAAPAYVRVPTVGTHPDFIRGLAGLVRHAPESPLAIAPGAGDGACRGRQRCACPRPGAGAPR